MVKTIYVKDNYLVFIMGGFIRQCNELGVYEIKHDGFMNGERLIESPILAEIVKPGLAKIIDGQDELNMDRWVLFGNKGFDNMDEIKQFLTLPYDVYYMIKEDWPDPWLITLNELYNEVNDHTLISMLTDRKWVVMIMRLLTLGVHPGDTIKKLYKLKIKDENLRANLHMKLQLFEGNADEKI